MHRFPPPLLFPTSMGLAGIRWLKSRWERYLRTDPAPPNSLASLQVTQLPRITQVINMHTEAVKHLLLIASFRHQKFGQ